MLANNEKVDKINISVPSSTSPYYQDVLNSLWVSVKRCSVYEHNAVHSVNCICCERIPNPVLQISNRKKKKPKEAQEAGVH
jgi:hypothetical protein